MKKFTYKLTLEIKFKAPDWNEAVEQENEIRTFIEHSIKDGSAFGVTMVGKLGGKLRRLSDSEGQK